MIVLVIFTTLSIAANALLIFLLLKNKPKRSQDYDSRMLLHDLTAGDALVRITRISPADVLLRGPR